MGQQALGPGDCEGAESQIKMVVLVVADLQFLSRVQVLRFDRSASEF
jgi:hypothetical protein